MSKRLTTRPRPPIGQSTGAIEDPARHLPIGAAGPPPPPLYVIAAKTRMVCIARRTLILVSKSTGCMSALHSKLPIRSSTRQRWLDLPKRLCEQTFMPGIPPCPDVADASPFKLPLFLTESQRSFIQRNCTRANGIAAQKVHTAESHCCLSRKLSGTELRSLMDTGIRVI